MGLRQAGRHGDAVLDVALEEVVFVAVLFEDEVVGLDEIGGGAEVLEELDGAVFVAFDDGFFGFEVGCDVGSSKGVDGLFGVADDEESIFWGFKKQTSEDVPLDFVGVLEFVDERKFILFAQHVDEEFGVGVFGVIESFPDHAQHVIEIEETAFFFGAQGAFDGFSKFLEGGHADGCGGVDEFFEGAVFFGFFFEFVDEGVEFDEGFGQVMEFIESAGGAGEGEVVLVFSFAVVVGASKRSVVISGPGFPVLVGAGDSVGGAAEGVFVPSRAYGGGGSDDFGEVGFEFFDRIKREPGFEVGFEFGEVCELFAQGFFEGAFEDDFGVDVGLVEESSHVECVFAQDASAEAVDGVNGGFFEGEELSFEEFEVFGVEGPVGGGDVDFLVGEDFFEDSSDPFAQFDGGAFGVGDDEDFFDGDVSSVGVASVEENFDDEMFEGVGFPGAGGGLDDGVFFEGNFGQNMGFRVAFHAPALQGESLVLSSL